MTIKELAKICNVSSSLVSKALNGYTDINPQTKDLIIKKAKEVGYVPNHYARNLSSKKNEKIAFIVKSSRNKSFIDELTIRYTTSVFNYAYDKIDIIILLDGVFKNKTLEQSTSYLKSLNIGGIILFGINKNKDELYYFINNKNFKTVVLDVPIIGLNTSSVVINDELAQYNVAQKTIDKNYNNILYLSGPKDDILAQKRICGIKKLQKELGFNLKIYEANYQDDLAYDIILKNHNFDAFICANDMMAIGCIKALKKLNINKKVTGFDGINLINYIDYPITSVEQNIKRKSKLAVEEIQRLFKDQEPQIIYDDFKIIYNSYYKDNKSDLKI